MKPLLRSLCFLLAAGPLFAQTADDITAAAKKLADKGAYQWVSRTDFGASAAGNNSNAPRMGPTEGWRDKDGLTLLKMTRNDSTTELVIKGEKGAFKADGNWQTVDTSDQGGGGGGGGGGQPNPGRNAARALRSFKAPNVEAAELAGKAKDFKKDGDAVVATLSEEAAKALMSFGGRRGGGGPDISDAKGTVKFWTKDGVLAKYEYHVQGKMSFNGNDREIDRTTTVEIKDGGPAPEAIPEAAKKLVS